MSIILTGGRFGGGRRFREGPLGIVAALAFVVQWSPTPAVAQIEDGTSKEPLKVDPSKDYVRYKGQDLNFADFKNACTYVDETNFTTVEPESAVFVEAKIGAPAGDLQTLSLRRHGEDTRIVCEFDRTEVPVRMQKQIRENKIVWAYGWFTDGPSGENLVEAISRRAPFRGRGGADVERGGRGRGRGGFGGGWLEDPGPASRVREAKRTFQVVVVGSPDVKSAIDKLRISAALTDPQTPAPRGETFEALIEVANKTASPMVDVEVKVFAALNDSFQSGQIIDSLIVDFPRVPAKQTASQIVSLFNRSPASVVPRVRAAAIHAVTARE
jgi:hypothetical protein